MMPDDRLAGCVGLERTERILDFLCTHKAQTIPHSSSTYWAHVLGVARLLSSWEAGDAMFRVGLLHSIYNEDTAQQAGISFADRPKIRELLGQRSEELVYLNRVFGLTSIKKVLRVAVEPYTMVDRLAGDRSVVSRTQFEDFRRIRSADRLEQVPRVRNWSYQQDVFLRMAQRLGGPSLDAFERLYRAARPLNKEDRPGGVQVGVANEDH